MNICSLTESIRTASLLAQSDNVIRKILRNNVLSDNEKEWTLNMFNMNDFVDEHSGKVAYLVYSKNKENIPKVLALSKKISKKQLLTEEEWQFIRLGMEEFRSKLIIKARQCACGCD